MAARHPFDWLSTSGQTRASVALLVLALVVMVSLNALGRPLNTEVAPAGIVSFELAGELSLAQSMVESWGQTGQVYAGLNLGLDYLFLVAYSSSIVLGCVLVTHHLSQRVEFLSLVGVLLAWAQFGAALLDTVENYALIQVLLGSQQALWPAVDRWCAIPKFLIVAAGLAYVGVGAVLTVVTKARRPNEHTRQKSRSKDMRIALLSDIHGNPIALDAVLADVQAQCGVDAYWMLGDLAAIGHDPVGVLERLVALPNVRFVRGNTDRYVVTGERPNPTFAAAQSDPRLLPLLVDVAQSFAWTQGAITATGWLEWLAALPFEQRVVLADGTRLLGVHASPGSDERGVHPGLSEAEVRALFAGCAADLVFVGHTHGPMDLRVGGVHIVNLGSVSNPLPPDLRASYVILEADDTVYRLQHRWVDYDHQAVIAAAHHVRHPVAGYIARYMLGQRRAGWMQR